MAHRKALGQKRLGQSGCCRTRLRSTSARSSLAQFCIAPFHFGSVRLWPVFGFNTLAQHCALRPCLAWTNFGPIWPNPTDVGPNLVMTYKTGHLSDKNTKFALHGFDRFQGIGFWCHCCNLPTQGTAKIALCAADKHYCHCFSWPHLNLFSDRSSTTRTMFLFWHVDQKIASEEFRRMHEKLGNRNKHLSDRM